MRRASLPGARIEPRGLRGHAAHLGAHARESARVAGRVSLFITKVLTAGVAFLVAIGLLVWLAPPPRSTAARDLDRLRIDLARTQERGEELRRALDALARRDFASPRGHLVAPPPPTSPAVEPLVLGRPRLQVERAPAPTSPRAAAGATPTPMAPPAPAGR